MTETANSPTGDTKPLTPAYVAAKIKKALKQRYEPILPQEEWIGEDSTRRKYQEKHRRISAKNKKARKAKAKIKDFNDRLAEGQLVHNPKELQLGPIIRDILSREDYYTRKSNAIMIAEALVNSAKSGNLLAITEILNRVDGRVTEKHEVSSAPITLVFKPAEDPALITPALESKVEVLATPALTFIEAESKELPNDPDPSS